MAKPKFKYERRQLDEGGEITRFATGELIVNLALNDMERHQMRPCPFCKAVTLTLSNTHTAYYSVACDDCGAEVHGAACGDGKGRNALSLHRRAKASAIATWNRRG